MKRKAVWAGAAFAAACAMTISGCGGSDSPTGPSGGGGSAQTITIGADGRVSPANVTVSVGSRVTFVNNHNQPHEMASNPHPEHTQCPEITVGLLQPNQSQTTQNLNTARTCGYHDHIRDTDTGLQGTIRIQ